MGLPQTLEFMRGAGLKQQLQLIEFGPTLQLKHPQFYFCSVYQRSREVFGDGRGLRAPTVIERSLP